MQLGFFTDCLPNLDLSSVAGWAKQAGYQALEIAAWPRAGEGRGTHASHLDVTDPGCAETTAAILAEHGLVASAIGYYENNLHHDADQRRRIHRHLAACIDAAAALSVPCVTTFVGRDTTRTVRENLALAGPALRPLVDHAGERGVKLAVENCPMEGWHPDGYPANLAYSPELWEWAASLGFHLNYDPSHLLWLGIDPVQALRAHLDWVVHVQAKDTQVDVHARTRYGVFGKTVERHHPFDAGWWRYRVPGLGDADWRRLVDLLHEAGYSGVVAVEHEDPVWQGSEQRIKRGLRIAHRTLHPLIVA
ncbi:sugar phosphate isomerase/epimerase [Frankia sp. Cj3]|uniref:sugar phosphate isomerase/epimerase family protein n=1 Tax=Frankia sp. Cj3 TaxID=2880976 RepID=UPI001EF3E2B6|nr:sugar phosphate isomerase/epimerase [Frankia sp. Cj3]